MCDCDFCCYWDFCCNWDFCCHCIGTLGYVFCDGFGNEFEIECNSFLKANCLFSSRKIGLSIEHQRMITRANLRNHLLFRYIFFYNVTHSLEEYWRYFEQTSEFLKSVSNLRFLVEQTSAEFKNSRWKLWAIQYWLVNLIGRVCSKLFPLWFAKLIGFDYYTKSLLASPYDFDTKFKSYLAFQQSCIKDVLFKRGSTFTINVWDWNQEKLSIVKQQLGWFPRKKINS